MRIGQALPLLDICSTAVRGITSGGTAANLVAAFAEPMRRAWVLLKRDRDSRHKSVEKARGLECAIVAAIGAQVAHAARLLQYRAADARRRWFGLVRSCVGEPDSTECCGQLCTAQCTLRNTVMPHSLGKTL